MPGEGIFWALIRAAYMDLCGPAENPDLLSCDGGFLWSFSEQLRGFHDLLREKPPPPPCSYCLDGAQGQSPLWWCHPCIWVWWRGWRCGVPSQLLSLSHAFTLVSWSTCSTLKMEAIWPSETSVDFQWTTRCYTPECSTFHSHCCDNLKSYTMICMFVFLSLWIFVHNNKIISNIIIRAIECGLFWIVCVMYQSAVKWESSQDFCRLCLMKGYYLHHLGSLLADRPLNMKGGFFRLRLILDNNLAQGLSQWS
jgi:hypothetical protein